MALPKGMNPRSQAGRTIARAQKFQKSIGYKGGRTGVAGKGGGKGGGGGGSG